MDMESRKENSLNNDNEENLISQFREIEYKSDILHILFSAITDTKEWRLRVSNGKKNKSMLISTPALQDKIIQDLRSKDMLAFSMTMYGHGASADHIADFVADTISMLETMPEAQVTTKSVTSPLSEEPREETKKDELISKHEDVLPVFEPKKSIILPTPKDLYNAARKGDLEQVKTMLETHQDHGLKPDGGTLLAAIKSGNVGLVKYFKEQHGLVPKSGIMEATDEAKSFEMVKYLMETYPSFRFGLDNTITWAAARTGDVEFLKYFLYLDLPRIYADTGTLYDAVRANSLTIVKYLVEQYGIKDLDEACELAKDRGSETIFAYLKEKRIEILKNYIGIEKQKPDISDEMYHQRKEKVELKKTAKKEEQQCQGFDKSFSSDQEQSMGGFIVDEDEYALQAMLLAQFEMQREENKKKQANKAPEKNVEKEIQVDTKDSDLKKRLNLPEDVTLGKAVDDGGCFFDALAQAINNSKGDNKHSEKTLRMACHRYYFKHKEEVDAWNEKDYGGIDRGEYDYSFIQYTKHELDQYFSRRSPIWGRPNIEGVMICRELELDAVCVLEAMEHPECKDMIPSFRKVTPVKDSSISEEEGMEIIKKGTMPTLVGLQSRLHFIPVLQKRMALEVNDAITPKAPLKSESQEEILLSKSPAVSFFTIPKPDKPACEMENKDSKEKIVRLGGDRDSH
jgi:hypothetical protein